MLSKRSFILALVFGCVSLCLAQTKTDTSNTPFNGFQGAQWAASPDQVHQATGATGWQSLGADNGFPKELGITVYSASMSIAGYPAKVKYYFYDNQFFQATVSFLFEDLVNFDFNYNVFISVDRYYHAIHDKTITFVTDIYDLLRKKYGTKEPIFKGLDPRFTFAACDQYIGQEVWNLRYHPSEYYRRIVTASYARWDFPKTRVTFSINISAADRRFDYMLSATSIELEQEIVKKKDELRSKGL